MPEPEKLLEINNLTVSFKTDEGTFKAVDDVSFKIGRGEIVGLVGESGCGKSVTALSLLRLIPSPPGNIEKGEIFLNNTDLLRLDAGSMRKIRGNAISIIFQEPAAALSPLHGIGRQMVEALRFHEKIDKKRAWKISENWLKSVGIPDAGEMMFAYPFQLSGGMQQRVMIAIALMLKPDLLIADEPTTALDVTTQAQVFDLMRKMKQEQTSILLITHDMGVVWETCDRVIIMYASRIAEKGTKNDIFLKPAHPYTQGLLKSIPKLSGRSKRLTTIPGHVPSPFQYPLGCHYYDRCPHAFERCKKEKPELADLGNGHMTACFLALKDQAYI